MNKEKVTSFQVGIMVLFLTNGLMGITYTFKTMLELSGTDTWISIILGIIIGFLPIVLYLKIMKYKENMNIITLNNHLFGKFLGGLFNIILIVTFILLGSIILHNLEIYVTLKFLYNTPLIAIRIAFILLCVYAVIKGIETILRAGQILIYIVLTFMILNFIGLIPSFDIYNIMPILNTNVNNLFISSFLYTVMSTAPLLMIMILTKEQIVNKNKFTKTIIIFYIASHLLIFIMHFLTISTLGLKLVTLYDNPVVMLLNKSGIFQMFDRTEHIIGALWLIVLLFSVIYILYFVITSIKQNFNITKKIIINIIISIITIAIIILSGTYSNDYYNIYIVLSIIAFIIIPIIVTLKIKLAKLKQPKI